MELHEAARNGDLEKVKELLKDHPYLIVSNMSIIQGKRK